MRQRRETVEHPFGTVKASMGATHFLMKTLPRVASEMALHVLAYNLTRVSEHHGHSAAHGRDEGLAKPEKGTSTQPDQDLYASTLPAKRFYTTHFGHLEDERVASPSHWPARRMMATSLTRNQTQCVRRVTARRIRRALTDARRIRPLLDSISRTRFVQGT